MRIHNTCTISKFEILSCHYLKFCRLTCTRLSDDIEVTKSILICYANFFCHALVCVISEKYSITGEIYGCFYNLEILPTNFGSFVVFGMREMKYGSNFLDIEHGFFM